MKSAGFTVVRMLMLVAVAGVFWSSSATAIIVHHCDYTGLWGPEVHEHHQNSGCSNKDVTNEEGHEGTCNHQTGFYWTEMECSEFGCTVRGTIDCPNGDKFYHFECWGDSARANSTRASAECEANGGGGSGEYVSHSCTCDFGCE